MQNVVGGVGRAVRARSTLDGLDWARVGGGVTQSDLHVLRSLSGSTVGRMNTGE